jgi:SAM-dependent methyltransferase
MYHPKPQSCPVCSTEVSSRFLKQSGVPTNCSALYATAGEAQAVPRGDIELAFCCNCGMIFNAEFDREQVNYDASYENSLRFSPTFCEYADSLATRLVNTHGLRGKRIVEVGCGDGEFLRAICRKGGNRGAGFDPSFAGVLDDPAVSIIRNSYDEVAADTPADFICCRHVLEHIDQPRELLLQVHRALSGRAGSVAYFEVPDALAVLSGSAIWDVIYPHCNYFTAVSLSGLFESCHFIVHNISMSFGQQYLAIEASPCAYSTALRSISRSLDIQKLSRVVERFRLRFRETVEQWARFLEYAHAEGRRVVLWGAGAKAVTFLNTSPGASRIASVVDMNPRKQGSFVPGTGHPVIAPGALAAIQPDILITLNPVYEGEIRRIAGEMGLTAEVITKPGIPILSARPVRHLSAMAQKMH